jgi:hypothetical protein
MFEFIWIDVKPSCFELIIETSSEDLDQASFNVLHLFEIDDGDVLLIDLGKAL